MRLGARGDALARLRAAGELDVLVVGGGATGAGIVLEATLRGYRCALVEGADFASGTSSRSTKQIHGGLRYLIRGDVRFVQESLRERAFLLTHSTKLLAPLRHIAPLELTGDLTKTAVLLAAYDRLAEPSPLPASRALTRAEVREAVPWLSGNEGGFEYYEAAASDTRLTLAVLTAAAEHGAIVVNHLRVTAVEPPAAVAVDTLSRHSVTLRARHVVLAIGPWLQQFAHETGLPEVPLLPARGTHLVLRQPEPPLEIAVVLHHPADRRPLVLAPWHGHLLLGTTDAVCDPKTIERPLPTAADVAYLLEGMRVLAPDWPVAITAAWAGVRPLLAADSERETVDLSRQDRLLDLAPGVLGIAGGKLTTLRAVAQRVCDLLEQRLRTQSGPAARFPHLTDPLESLNQEEQLLDAARHEMVATLDDLLTQRLGISLVSPEEALKQAPEWAMRVASTMGWSSAEQEQQVQAYRAGLARFRVPSGVAW
jgi:glycerol-3-phosphate dehydrogenase